MARNLALDCRLRARGPQAKTLPLPDARPVLPAGWPGTEFYMEAAMDPDWLRTYTLPPYTPRRLRDARRLGLISPRLYWYQDHSACPNPRPRTCDRYAPQAWHANPHSATCLNAPRPQPSGARP